MGWFEKQIEKRRIADQKLLEESFANIAAVVIGQHHAQKIRDDMIVTKNAIDEILKYNHYTPVDIPEKLKTFDERIDYSLRPHGLMRRTVELKEGWHKDAYGAMIAFTKEEDLPVALLQSQMGGYYYHDPITKRRITITARTEKLFKREALCFYRPLPLKKLEIIDLLIYMKRTLTFADVAFVVAGTLIMTLVGLVIPRITKALTGPVLESNSVNALISIAICLVCISISSQLFTNILGLIQQRLSTKTSLGVQSAMMMRLMSLPANFFRQYSPGELRSRSLSVNQLCTMLMNLFTTTGLTSLMSLLYITQIFKYAPALVIPSLIIILVTVGISVISTVMQVSVSRKMMQFAAKESGMSYSLITGVQKLKLAGAEKRSFAKWLKVFSQGAELQYNPPLFLKLNGVITTAITLISNIVIYYMAVASGVDQSSYFAFTAAYGSLMGAFASVSGMALTFAQIKPILEMAEPFLNTEPEITENKKIVTDIIGGVELDHVSFKYTEDGPLIIDDLSFKIRPGEYVAIVGKTGCGKSTLVRLLLGFEKADRGVIYYDNRNINSLDLGSLRRKIGTVMQDAGLFQGDIYSNIVITAPELTLDDAWEAAEKAGIDEDIRNMPMQMNTIISEGQGGISGGQKQRIMIARAIAPKPKMLIFDEATSALDNKTQKQVSDSLDKMGCTRIVIAHRLSTIKHCDRIIVIDKGKIIEDGTYDELVAQNGFFADLVERQRLDSVG